MANFQNSKSLLQFEPAQLYNKSDWYVQYKVVNPYTNKLTIKKCRLNRIKSITERKRYAKKLINTINEKLYSGWNPFLEEEAPKAFTILTTAADYFYKVKSKELRPDSLRSYRSMLNWLSTWLIDNKLNDIYIISFTKQQALQIMKDSYDIKDLNNKTYNNYLRFYTTLWNWFIEQGYCKTNAFAGVKSKKQETKDRTLIPEATRAEIKQYFKANNKQMYIVSLLVFHTLLRPKEITFLKQEHFDFENQIIRIPGTVAKNHNMRIATIPDVILGDLIQFNFNNSMPQDYIFGIRGLSTSKKMDPREFTRDWSKMRESLKLNKTMKLYSLRDSGIVQLLIDGVSPDEVMKQADHSSLDITTVYIKHANPTGSLQIKEKNSSF
jgi:integrase